MKWPARRATGWFLICAWAELSFCWSPVLWHLWEDEGLRAAGLQMTDHEPISPRRNHVLWREGKLVKQQTMKYVRLQIVRQLRISVLLVQFMFGFYRLNSFSRMYPMPKCSNVQATQRELPRFTVLGVPIIAIQVATPNVA